jgi:hypothetical protein
MGRPPRKDLVGLHSNEEGRSTPLPQYEKTQSVPFNLTLQEDKKNPGQFQLVVNIDPEHPRRDGSPPRPAASKKLYANLQSLPSLGFDVSQLYQTQKSSPPISPQQEKGWSDLDAIPSEFLQKVVPDWEVTFQRKDSTASTQSRKLADIKARIKKSGKGFVVRLLKGSGAGSNEVAEVQLGQHDGVGATAIAELDSCPQAELDATEISHRDSVPSETTRAVQLGIHEIGTSSEPGIQKFAPPAPSARIPSIPNWLSQTATSASRRHSVLDDSFSDAETLTQEVRSVVDLTEDATDIEPFSAISSMLPTRTASVSSIVKTPTRGLSVVGPVKRINKQRGKGVATRLDLNRSDARKSVKKRSPRGSYAGFTTGKTTFSHEDSYVSTLRQRPGHANRRQTSVDETPEENKTWSQSLQEQHPEQGKMHRRSSAGDLLHPKKASRTQLKLQTDVPRPKSANNSPVTKRKRSPRFHKSRSSSSSVHFAEEPEQVPSPAWSEEQDPSDELRIALERAFGTVDEDISQATSSRKVDIPRIEEPKAQLPAGYTGEIPLLPGLEIRSAPQVGTTSPTLTFWGLVVSALSEKLIDGLQAFRLKYGSEPPVPQNHVRVRWTCSCGEPLYDDFIEQRPGAARLLEAFLNRPRSHTPSPSSGRTSTSSTMSSVFDSVSRASTLATPSSSYGGPSSWGKGDPSNYSPTRLRTNNPFSVRMPTFVEESWLLTCANEGRFTPKIVHLDVSASRVKSDKDLALTLREHYEQLNRRWLKWARLRGLATIEFVQFEVHRNRFADIRASPSMPPRSSSQSKQSPSEQPYSFEPVDLVPPVGSTYLLHLFKHPEDYDGELITYLRSPKRRERLEFGMGWGINLVEGFLAQKIWACFMLFFGFGSGVFAILWTIKKQDVQGAFGVAGWVVTLAGLLLGGLQAWLE